MFELIVCLCIGAILCGATLVKTHKPSLRSTCKAVSVWLRQLRTAAIANAKRETVQITAHDIRSSTSTRIRGINFASDTVLGGASQIVLYQNGVTSPASISLKSKEQLCILSISLHGRMQCICR